MSSKRLEPDSYQNHRYPSIPYHSMFARLTRYLTFNLWYLGHPPWDTGISPPELLHFIQHTPAGRALDLGCGSGLNCLTLAQAGWQVTGVDFAWLAIAHARRRFRQANLPADLHVGDVTGLSNIAGPFDLILDIGCFHALTAPARLAYAEGLQRLLAPSGAWLVYAFLTLADPPGMGISESEIDRFSRRLALVSRQDSPGRRGRPSTWLHFRKDV